MSEHSELILDDKFMGVKEPMWDLEKEQPWHRSAAFAFALGIGCREVARRLGKSEPAVQNLLRQKWFQKEVTSLQAQYGAKDRGLMDLFQAESYSSLATLVEVRDSPRTPSAVKVACARDILDRGMGKPVQRIESTNVVSSDDPVAEEERLLQEVNRMRGELYGCEAQPSK